MAERQLSDERRPDLRHGRLCAGLVELRGAHGAVNRALYYGVELVDEVETGWTEQYLGDAGGVNETELTTLCVPVSPWIKRADRS